MKLTNKLLIRQLKRLGPKVIPDEWERFLVTIDDSYNQFDSELKMLESTSAKMVKTQSELNRSLTRLNESLDGFNYHVSHDLKTSFMNTQGLVHMLEKYVEKQDIDKIANICDKLNTNAKNSIKTINEFLDISRLDNEMKKAEKHWCNIDGIISSCIFRTEGIHDNNVCIKINGFKEIYFNETALRSIFHNLVTNGIKYKKKDQDINITFETGYYKDQPFISYSDNGIGIDVKKEKENLFKPFSRLTNSRGIEGSGVGLFLIKKTIETAGGSIKLEGEEGKGIKIFLNFDNNDVR